MCGLGRYLDPSVHGPPSPKPIFSQPILNIRKHRNRGREGRPTTKKEVNNNTAKGKITGGVEVQNLLPNGKRKIAIYCSWITIQFCQFEENIRGVSEFESVKMSDLDRQIEQLKRCEPLKESEVKALCLKAMEILVEESNVQRVDAPVTVSQRKFLN